MDVEGNEEKFARVTLANELTSFDQLGHFDVIGFDADFTLVKYNTNEM